MKRRDRPVRTTLLTPVLILTAAVTAPAQEPKTEGVGLLRQVEAVRRPDLAGVVVVAVAPDGKSLYAASFRSGSLNAFARDPETGRIDHRRTIADANLAGATSLVLSPDCRSAVATAFRSRTAVLYRRDAATGELSEADVARDDARGNPRLVFPTRAAFSTDGRFVYVVDARGLVVGGRASRGALTAFRVDSGKLAWVESNPGTDGCFANGRGLAVHPDGKTLLVANADAGTLVVLGRDERTGRTAVRQVLRDEEGGVHGLAGVMGLALSPDGRSAYTSAGRFGGDNAVSAFRIEDGGRVSVIQEFHGGQGDLKGFKGGNQIVVSPDGRNVYAAGSVSGSVACFRRDQGSGRLSLLETLPNRGRDGSPTNATGLGISPDGRFLYVSAEDDGSLMIYRRDAGR